MAGPAPLFREVHRLRSYAHALKEQLDRLPRQLKAQHARRDAAQAALSASQDRVKHLKVEATTKEKTLKSKNDAVGRFEGQLASMQSKKEFDAKQLEIAFAKAECGKLEDEILQAMTDGEEEAKRTPELDKALAAVKADVAKFEADVAPRKELWQKELAATLAKLKEIEPGVPKANRAVFDKTVASMGHDGFAAVRERTCGGCQGELTQQARNELEDEQFVMCRSCGRILYLSAGERPAGEE
ncbi:MAG: zinc ribbon domain-containing protein [Gemmataceae bacterium]